MVDTGWIELRRVSVGRAGHLRQPGNAGLGARGVVEQHSVPHAHDVAHEVAGLVVAYTCPWHRMVRRLDQVIDRALARLALHQPIRRHTRTLCCAPAAPVDRWGVRQVPWAAFLNPYGQIQVGEVRVASGSSDARRSHQPHDIPSPCSTSIGSGKYRTHAHLPDEDHSTERAATSHVKLVWHRMPPAPYRCAALRERRRSRAGYSKSPSSLSAASMRRTSAAMSAEPGATPAAGAVLWLVTRTAGAAGTAASSARW
jgi:hypothetical protein